MLYNLLYPLADDVGFFNLFRYLTFRTGGAVLTAILISFVFGPLIIGRVWRRRGRRSRRDSRPIDENHRPGSVAPRLLR